MSSDIAISVQNISKHFRMFDSPQDRLKQGLFRGRKQLFKEFWALKDISFDVEKGQTIGIIGSNGSGKSTLLQTIVGTLKPSSGKVEVSGRVAALLELGSGFNPEFTGRENVVMNGSIMGLSAKEIQEKIPLIEAFSGIGEFIDQPVRSYSSGMFVRLAFACAVNVDPDILIIDEALAVGDMQFQLKCIEKMKSFKKEGKTILFVSHDTYSIRNFCDQAIWMMNGQVHLRGNVNVVANNYEDFMKYSAEDTHSQEIPAEDKTKVLTIDKLLLLNSNREEVNEFAFSEKITLEVNYSLLSNFEGIVGGIALYDNQNNYVCGLNTKLDHYVLPNLSGNYKLVLSYEKMNLLPGTYFIDVGFFESSGLVRLDFIKRLACFTIKSGDYFAEGITFIEHNWKCEGSL